MVDIAERIPVITIGGFLGAGKTTLVNNILAQANGRRIVIFINDFGAVNIDHALIETAVENRISLKNGCVCCSLNDDLISSINAFSNDGSEPDAFVIEASGVSDPRSLDHSILMLEAAGSVRLDSRIYVLDAYHFGGQDYEDTETVIDHAAASDLIILNKTDLTTNEDIGNLQKVLKTSAPNSTLIETVKCAFPIEVFFQTSPISRNFVASIEGLNSLPHTDRYVRWLQQADQPIDRSRFETFARDLPDYFFRAKAVLRFECSPAEVHRFDLVGNRATLEPVTHTNVTGTSSIVGIGKSGGLDLSMLDIAFQKILVV